MKFDLLFADIIIADNDPDLLRRMRIVMLSAGYSVHTLQECAAVLASVRKQPPDLLLLGADLKDASGYDLMRTLRADASVPFIPIIFIAKSDQHADVATALNAGADDFIRLPVDNPELLVRTRALLRLKASSDYLAQLNVTLEEKVRQRTQQLEKIYEQLRHTEKLASLGRLAASIAHEINNPLAAILTYLGLIEVQTPKDSPVQEDVQIIQRQVNAIARLVRDLRDFSKPPRKERAPLVLNSVLEEVLVLTGKDLEGRNIQVQRQLDPDLQPILASSEQMGEIFLNLIMNARDAMSAGGILQVSSFSFDSCSQVQITDTGDGMPADVLERIFEPFFTTKGDHGTGLGLSVSYSIVQDHGGYLQVRSAPGQGATFMLGLPGLEKTNRGINCLVCPVREPCEQAWER